MLTRQLHVKRPHHLSEAATRILERRQHQSSCPGRKGSATQPAEQTSSLWHQWGVRAHFLPPDDAGKTKAAVRLLSNSSSGEVISLHKRPGGSRKTVFDIPQEKHPDAKGVLPNAVASDPTPSQAEPWNLVQFDHLNGSMIRTAALKPQRGAGPSGIDAKGWRRLCTAFYGAYRDLCNSVAQFTRRFATTYVDPAGLAAFIACRLVPLDQNPGVRPIGMCETVRRNVGKAIMHIVGEPPGPYSYSLGNKLAVKQQCMLSGRCLRTLQVTGYSFWTHRMLSTAWI